ncbi:MAG: asparagine synthase-related protein, partial [Candidatus Omnitrophota bacterium]
MPPFCGAISRKGPLAPDIKHRLKTLTDPQQQSCLRNDSPDGLFTGFASQILAGEGKASCEIPEYSVLFNGILYNHKDLLPLLPENSRALAEKSTPLLIAHLFHKYNHACFSRLNGVFSLALRDIPHRTFYLVNGKLQPRKIYYFFYEECLFFTEDMENIIKISGIRPSVNITFLPKYFAYGFVPSPNTLLEGIHRLPSGKFLLFEPDNMDLQTYWDIQFNDQNETSTIAKETHYSEEVFRVLCQSAERRLNADSRTGLFLSGGLDSSSLVAALKHISPGIPLQTFTAVFDEKSFNEAPKARTVASFFQTQHHEILFTPQKALTFVKDWIKEVDDPFSDDDIICGGVLSPIAEELVNDVFLGDGPDELFMGY